MSADERTVHLFRPGSIITLCCGRASLDARISKDLGTYESEAVTCGGAESEA